MKFMIELKGMTFDYDFGYSFSLFSSLLKKEDMENELAKIVIKSHAFQLGSVKFNLEPITCLNPKVK